MRVQFHLKAKTPEELSLMQIKNDLRRGESFNYTTPIVYKGHLVSFFWVQIDDMNRAIRVADRLEKKIK